MSNLKPLKKLKQSKTLKTLIPLKKKIKNRDLTLFSRKLATLVNAGLPLSQALQVIAEGYPKGDLHILILQIRRELERGQTFSSILKEYPHYFSSFYTGLIEIGELSGTLDILLLRLSANQEKTDNLKGKLKTAMIYPSIILGVALMVTLFLLTNIVPTFKEMFETFHMELPLATKLLLKISDILMHYSHWVIFISIFSCFCILQYYRKNKKFQHIIQKLSLRLPVFGPLIFKSQIATITRILATTETSGVPLNKALETLTAITKHIVFSHALHHIRRLVSQGQRLQIAMKATRVFPEMMTQMIGIAEESGSLDKILEKLSCILDEELETQLGQLTTLIEPLIMIFLGLLIGGLVIALYLPIFNMGSLV